MEYQQAVEKIRSRRSERKNPTLENTREALDRLGSPDQDYSVILIGGSNGKGSTVEMVSELLKSQDFKTGSFKSPHLTTCRERIQVDGEKISEEELVELYREIEELDIRLTFFEFMTVAAYLHFSREDVDYGIMEVGMGGRLDATNAADPDISVITNIEKEHTEYLGETEEEIAGEKAGIIPENGKIITRESYEPVEVKANERNSELIEPVKLREDDGKYIYRGEKFSLPVKGRFQKENAGNALATVRELGEVPADLQEALSDLECPGRMEEISDNPLYIQDGAHNPAALEKIVEDLPEGFICIFNTLKSKDIGKMVDILEGKASGFYFTESNFRLSENPDRIAQYTDKQFKVVEDPGKAEKLALEESEKTGKPLVATGSLYLIGDLKSEE